jgi:peptide/nickel transport system substrate-binding protein
VKRLLVICLVIGLAAVGISACGGGGSSSSSSSSSEPSGGETGEASTGGETGDTGGSGNTDPATGEPTGDQEGKNLEITYSSFPDYMDPQLSYTAEGWQAMSEVYIPLLTYKHGEGAEGSEVVPGLAKEMPKVTNGGKTYTLFLRPGLKYSDGSPVKASDFPYAVERMFIVNSGGSPFYTTIVGAQKFAETKKGGIPGIKTNDKTGEISITLEKPRGTFNNELALMFVAPVPQTTAEEDLSANPPPGTGPYMLKNVKPGAGWEYERNPAWANNVKLMPEYPTGHVGSAKVTIIRNPQTQVNDIEQGKFQFMQNPVPAARYSEVKEQYEGTQFRVVPTISTYYFWMNNKVAPFNDLKVREAVNYAVDQRALERVYSGQIKGTQQILPPGLPGYKKFELFPHDMAKAKELLKEANPSDMDITVWTDDESPNKEAGEYYESLLNEIGFNATLKIINKDDYFTVIGNESTPNLDTGWGDWFEDYPHPNDFFQPLLATESILPTNSSNFARFSDPALDKKITKNGEEVLGPEQEAEYEAMDEEAMKEAPWAPYGTRTLDVFTSSDLNTEGIVSNPTFREYLSSMEFNE